EQAATSTPPSRGESAPPSVEAPVLPTLSKEKDVEEKKDELSNTFQNIDQWASNATHDQFGDFSDTPSSKESDSNKKNPDNEEWAKKILEEDELEQVAQANQDTSEAPESKVAPSNDQKNNIQATADPFGIGEELKDFVDKPEKPTANLDAKDVLATINLEPVELDLNSDGKKKVFHFIGETLLVLLATLLLGTQYLTYNFESLSKDPKLRPWYAKACATLNCTLPQQSDIKKIRGKNLVVRTHPDIPDALLVDIVMTNHARFSQKLPLLELAFTDINGFPVAGRKFKPSEYLSGALIKLNNLPAKTPVHISLSIFDPGGEAINYHVNYHKR
ncbi:MAG: DUF3426 domain-containing protein, partial [Pseudomonadales bacterium]|nr:DUF3426 domain-containing protein [Pseudomonadales bacterium]